MEDVVTIASGFRADYYYRCRRDVDGNIVAKHFLYCRPRKGFHLFRVEGHYRITPDDDWHFHTVRYTFATDEQDAILQHKKDWWFKPSYAVEVGDSAERKRILSYPSYKV